MDNKQIVDESIEDFNKIELKTPTINENVGFWIKKFPCSNYSNHKLLYENRSKSKIIRKYEVQLDNGNKQFVIYKRYIDDDKGNFKLKLEMLKILIIGLMYEDFINSLLNKNNGCDILTRSWSMMTKFDSATWILEPFHNNYEEVMILDDEILQAFSHFVLIYTNFQLIPGSMIKCGNGKWHPKIISSFKESKCLELRNNHYKSFLEYHQCNHICELFKMDKLKKMSDVKSEDYKNIKLIKLRIIMNNILEMNSLLSTIEFEGCGSDELINSIEVIQKYINKPLINDELIENDISIKRLCDLPLWNIFDH